VEEEEGTYPKKIIILITPVALIYKMEEERE
jgi:hypothetical protein